MKPVQSVIILTLFIFLPVTLRAGDPAIFEINSETVTSLEGYWKVNRGDDLRWKEPGFDDSAWRFFPVPGNLQELYGRFTGIAWYRAGIRVKGHDPLMSYSVELGKISDVDEVYFNGVKIGGTGSINDPDSHFFDRVRIYTIPNGLMVPTGTNVLAVRVRGYLNDSIGLIWGSYHGGDTSRIYRKYNIANIIDAVIIGVYIFIFIYFLIYSFYPNYFQVQQRSLSLLSLAFAVYLFCIGQIKYLFTENFYLCHKVQYGALVLLVFFAIVLFRNVFLEGINRVDVFIIVLLALILAAMMIIPEIRDLSLPRIILQSTLAYAAVMILIKLITHFKKKYIYIHVGFIALLVFSLLEILRSYTIAPDFDYFKFGLITFVFTLSFFQAEQVSKTEMIEQKIRKDLERDINAKTVELTERNSAIEQELEIARLIQRKLLPESIDHIPGLSVFAYCTPIDKVGGDFYDIWDDGDTVRVIVADVSGHGIPSAFLALITKIAFNYKFLVDFLSSIKTKKVEMDLLRSDAPVVFRPEGQKNFLHIIMPVRIQD